MKLIIAILLLFSFSTPVLADTIIHTGRIVSPQPSKDTKTSGRDFYLLMRSAYLWNITFNDPKTRSQCQTMLIKTAKNAGIRLNPPPAQVKTPKDAMAALKKYQNAAFDWQGKYLNFYVSCCQTLGIHLGTADTIIFNVIAVKGKRPIDPEHKEFLIGQLANAAGELEALRFPGNIKKSLQDFITEIQKAKTGDDMGQIIPHLAKVEKQINDWITTDALKTNTLPGK